MNRLFFFLAITFASVPGFPTDSYAQDFEVAPVVIDFHVEPGQSGTQYLNLRNHSKTLQKFTLNVNDYVLNDEGEKQPKPPGSTEHSLANWITVNPSFLELQPNGSKKIEVKLTVPKGENGTKWGMIKIRTAKEQSAQKADKKMATGLVIVPQISVYVNQAPESNTNFAGEIDGLQEITSESDTVRKFKVNVHNTGDRILRGAKIWLATTDLNTAKEKRFEPKKITLFPDRSREMVLTLPKDAPLETGKKYALAAIFDYGNRKTLKGAQIMIEGK